MDQDRVIGIVALILSVGGTIIGIINHKRVRSKCCGKNLEVQVDIEQAQSSPKPVEK